jgi:hypothetical protein
MPFNNDFLIKVDLKFICFFQSGRELSTSAGQPGDMRPERLHLMLVRRQVRVRLRLGGRLQGRRTLRNHRRLLQEVGRALRLGGKSN